MNTCLIDSVAMRGSLPACTATFRDEYGSRVPAVAAALSAGDRARWVATAGPAAPKLASRPFH